MFELEVEIKYRHDKLQSKGNHKRLLKQAQRNQPERTKQLMHKIMVFAQAVSLQTRKVRQANSVTQVSLGSETV